MGNSQSVSSDLERTETKEYLEGEICFAIHSFAGDLRCYIDAASKVAVQEQVLRECEYIIKTLERSKLVIERALLDDEQFILPFPKNSW
jgi:hypothetical protein